MARFEYQVCQVQGAAVTFVNGAWQGDVPMVQLKEPQEIADHCPKVWEYLDLAGDKGWATGPMGNKDMEADDLQSARDEMLTDTIGVFRNLDKFQCQALDPTKVEGVMCNPVHVSGVGEDYQIFFLNAETGRVAMVQSPGVSPMTQAPVTQKVYVDDYMETAGFTMPKTLRLTYDDELFGTLTVEEFKANPKVDMGLFKK